MKTLVFAVAGYNLAETGRMIEIAREAKKYFNVIFASYGGAYESLIKEEGFTLAKMQPRLTRERLERLRHVLSGETLNTVGYLTRQELEVRVPNEVKFFQEVDAAAVLTGWCLSVTMSARAARIPFINVLHSTTVREYYEAGLQSWPDRTNFGIFRWWFGDDETKMNRWTSKLVLKLKASIRAYNVVGPKYGVPEFNNFIDLIEGDHTLLADIPAWVGFPEIRPSLHYIGPLPFRINRPVPKELTNMSRDKPIIYFAMGSSGKPQLIADILEGFRDKPYRVIAPVQSHIVDMNPNIPENVTVTGFLPAHKVNPMADIAVVHGGQNTVMNACLSGTPIVGIGMHPEQQANLDACVRKGFAIRLNKRRAKAADVLTAIDNLLNDKNAQKQIEIFRQQLKQWDGPANAAQFLRENLGKTEDIVNTA